MHARTHTRANVSAYSCVHRPSLHAWVHVQRSTHAHACVAYARAQLTRTIWATRHVIGTGLRLDAHPVVQVAALQLPLGPMARGLYPMAYGLEFMAYSTQSSMFLH